MFAHTFNPDDVTVLLERIEPNYLNKEDRQALIEQGVHYNELISREDPPSDSEMKLFWAQVHRFGERMAKLVNVLADMIAERESQPVLVSLVRAGTPTGILVKHALEQRGLEAPHYSVSIVQGRGFDEVAIAHILSQGFRPSQLIFIDGWTGKGVVRAELSAALKKMEPVYGAFNDELYVLSDIAGVADVAASREDMLIPSALMSGPLCGLVSRTLYRGSEETPQYHGAALLDYMQDCDVSQEFIDVMDEHVKNTRLSPYVVYQRSAEEASGMMKAFLAKTKLKYGLPSFNEIKPGVGESSRLFLRKKPRLLIVRDMAASDVVHLVELANSKGVDIEVDAAMPYMACTLVK